MPTVHDVEHPEFWKMMTKAGNCVASLTRNGVPVSNEVQVRFLDQ